MTLPGRLQIADLAPALKWATQVIAQSDDTDGFRRRFHGGDRRFLGRRHFDDFSRRLCGLGRDFDGRGLLGLGGFRRLDDFLPRLGG